MIVVCVYVTALQQYDNWSAVTHSGSHRGEYFLGTLCTKHVLNTLAYLNIVANHVHPFKSSLYPSSHGYFQQVNVLCQRAQLVS